MKNKLRYKNNFNNKLYVTKISKNKLGFKNNINHNNPLQLIFKFSNTCNYFLIHRVHAYRHNAYRLFVFWIWHHLWLGNEKWCFFSGMCCGSQQDIPIRELRRDSGISYNFTEYLENLVRRVAMSWSFLTCRMM